MLAYRAGGGAGGTGLTHTEQVIAAALIVGGLAVKAPMFPLHTWLPPAHTVAPTGGSVLLAGVLLKLGTYGLVRVAVPVVPDGVRTLAPLLGALGVAGILWGGLACFAERDLKRLVAFSSVAHMGFVLLGIASLTAVGSAGRAVRERRPRARHRPAVPRRRRPQGPAPLAPTSPRSARGLRDRMPRLGWLLAFGALAALGLPGPGRLLGRAAGDRGCVATREGSRARSASWPGRSPSLAAVGTAVAAAYLLRVLRLVWHGQAPAVGPAPIPRSVPLAGDATRHELAVTGPLVVAVAALGVLPWLLLDVTGPAVRLLVGWGRRAVTPLTGVQSVDALAVAPVAAPAGGAAARPARWTPWRPRRAAHGRLHDVLALAGAARRRSRGGPARGRGRRPVHRVRAGRRAAAAACSYVVSPADARAAGGGARRGRRLPAAGRRRSRRAADRAPHHVLLLAAVAGAVALAGARDLATLVVALETATLPAIGLVALRRDPQGAQGAVTFLLTALTSLGLLLVGSALLVMATGSAHFERIAAALGEPGLPPRVRAVARPRRAARRRRGRLQALRGAVPPLDAGHVRRRTAAGRRLPVDACRRPPALRRSSSCSRSASCPWLPAWAPVVGVLRR